MTDPVPARGAAAAVRRALDGRHDVTAEPPPPPPPGWRVGERVLRLGTLAVVALAAALVTGRPWVLALAAAPLVLVALALPSGPRPEAVTAEAEVEPRRCFEGEQVRVRITVSYDGESGRLDPGVTLGHGVRLDHLAVGPHRVDLVLTAQRWGRWTLGTVDVDVYDRGGLARRTVRAELGEVAVFPLPGHAGLTPIPVRL
ncbi:DUF58 domain-containing protein, partial [Streptomyces sp. NPDC059802]